MHRLNAGQHLSVGSKSSSAHCPPIRTERSTAGESVDLLPAAPLHRVVRMCSLATQTGCPAPRQTLMLFITDALAAPSFARELWEPLSGQCPRSTSATGARPHSLSAVCAATFLTHESCSPDLRDTAASRHRLFSATGTMVKVQWAVDRHVENVAGSIALVKGATRGTGRKEKATRSNNASRLGRWSDVPREQLMCGPQSLTHLDISRLVEHVCIVELDGFRCCILRVLRHSSILDWEHPHRRTNSCSTQCGYFQRENRVHTQSMRLSARPLFESSR